MTTPFKEQKAVGRSFQRLLLRLNLPLGIVAEFLRSGTISKSKKQTGCLIGH